MYSPLKKVIMLLAVAVILMILIAAGIDTSSIQLAEVISRSIFGAVTHYSALIVLISAWLFTVGMMCRTLKKIPGIKSGRKGSGQLIH